MKKNKLLLLTAGLAIVLLAAALLYQNLSGRVDTEGAGTADTSVNNQQGETSQEEQQLVPDFTVYDVNGTAYRLSDFRGKPVVLNFWASWCGPCKSEMPDFDAKAAEFKDKVTFLMVNLTDGAQETVESASQFIGEQGYTFPVYYDTDMDAAANYGVSSVPVTFFIDEEGYGIARAMGAIDAATLQQGIDMILK